MEAKKPKTHAQESQFLASIVKDNIPLRGRIAILTLSTEASSKIVDRIILFIEYAQCLSLFFNASYKVYGQETTGKIQISNFALNFFRLLSPANFLTFNKDTTPFILSISYILIFAFLFRLVTFSLIVWKSFHKQEPSRPLVLIWKWIFWLQVRVVYYFMATIWINFFDAAYKEKLQLSDIQRKAYLFACMFMIFAEFIFSLVVQTQFSGVIPSKSLLSCKENKIEMITLVQKASNQIFRRIFTGDPRVGLWIVCVLALVLSIARLKFFVHYLSPYQIDSLFYQMYFLVIILAFNIACLAQIVLHDMPVDMDFTVILWILLSVLFVKLADEYLKNRIFKLFLSQSKNDSPEVLVHRVIAAKYILKTAKPSTTENSPCSWTYLLLKTISNNLGKAFDLTNENAQLPLSLKSKEERNKFFTIYLESLLSRFPKNNFLRLYTAYHYAKREKFYGLCLKTLGDIKNSTSWKIIVSKSILLHQMKNTIINDNRNQCFHYDLSEYIDCTSTLAQIKLNMRDQASLQISICQQLLGDSPNLAQIYTLGHKALSQRKSIEHWAYRELPKLPDYFLEPYLVLSQYYLNVNHSHERYRNCCGFYSTRQQKYEKIFTSGKFCQENFYREDVCTFIFSGEKENEGQVLECFGDTEELFGRDLKGLHMSTAVPPPTRSNPKTLFKMIHEHSQNSMVGRLINHYFYNAQGFMTEVEFYCNVIPYISKGLTYYVISKPVRNAKEAILIGKDGTIQCFTKYIGNKLDLFSMVKAHSAEEKNIRKISPELFRVNKAFNMMEAQGISATPDDNNKKFMSEEDDKSPINLEEANEICRVYREEGKIILLGNLTYRCTINLVVHNSNGSKYIILERQENDGDDDESIEDSSKSDPSFFRQEQEPEEDLEDNEKEKGWIDFQKLKTMNKTDGNLEPPLSSQRLPLVSTQTNVIFTTDQGQGQGRIPTFQNALTKKSKFEKREKDVSFTNTPGSVQESLFSLKSQGSLAKKIQLEKLFDQAVHLPFNRFIYKFLQTITYSAAIIAVGLQIYLTILVNSGFQSLESSKEILMLAEIRNRDLIDINGIMSFFMGHVVGLFTLQELSTTLDVPILVEETYGTLSVLNNANLDLLAVADTLVGEEHRILFEKDVRIFDTYFDSAVQTYETVTSFQGCNLMVETVLKALPLLSNSPADSMPYLQFALRNMLNDLLLKDADISELFHGLIQEKKNNTLLIINIFFGMLILVAISGSVIYGFLIFFRYKNEKDNLSAYTKLSKKAVKTVLYNLTSFQEMMDSNTTLEKILHGKQIPDHLTNLQVKSRQEESGRGILIKKGLAKPYLWISARVLFIYYVLISLFVGNLFELRSSFKNLAKKADQLYLIDTTDSTMVFMPDLLFELFLSNNSALILNLAPDIVIVNSIANLISLKNIIEDTFKNEENTIIQDIIYLDACKYFDDDPFIQDYCFQLTNYQENQGLLTMLGNSESMIQTSFNSYMNSNKTAAVIKELTLSTFRELNDPVFFAFRGLCAYLTNVINESFNEKLQSGKDVNVQFSVFIIIVVVVTGFYIHLWVINSLKKRENQFKNMLILFPPNVVLSNFILKTYLRRVSNESFESVRNEI